MTTRKPGQGAREDARVEALLRERASARVRLDAASIAWEEVFYASVAELDRTGKDTDLSDHPALLELWAARAAMEEVTGERIG